MSKTIKVALAGAGAFGIKHLDAIKLIDGVEVVSLISRDLDKTKETATAIEMINLVIMMTEGMRRLRNPLRTTKVAIMLTIWK